MSDTFNVEDIMEEIRREIKEKGYTDDTLSFGDIHPVYEGEKFDAQKCEQDLQSAKTYVYTEWNKITDTGIKRLIKKIICGVLSFLLHPVFSAQSSYNKFDNDAACQMYQHMKEQDEEIQSLKNEIRALQDELQEIKSRQ